jgi:hypothetical protein
MMTPEDRWRRVKALFELALEQVPANLEEWLDQEGETDEVVRAEVLSLLRHQKQSGSFLNTPIANLAPDLIPENHPLQEGQVVDKYTIVRELGRGGMGRVYLAIEQPLGRQVALKTPAPELASDSEYRERLRREALAAAALEQHLGICRLYEYREFEGTPYIAYEFVNGRTLRVEIDEGPRPTLEVIRQTAVSLADTLAFAHQHGITHRDFKPENVMRATAGRLKVLDFGLASVPAPVGGLASIVQTLTVPGALMGTLLYMSPEQLRGERADPRSDVFALGLVLYEYACGIHPFAATEPVGIIANILNSEPTPATSHRPDLPPALMAIIGRCLAKRPQDRFPSAVELTVALTDDVSKPKLITVPATDQLVGWWRRHQLAVIALYFTACALTWQVKEWEPGIATALFMGTCLAATLGGVVRGNLLFREKITSTRLAAEYQKAKPWTLVADVLVTLALLVDGALVLGMARPVPAVLTMALGVGIGVTSIVIEPRTTADAFAGPESA